MADITRTVQKKESLTILPCPFCGGDVVANDCGYSSFNPGFAGCKGTCKRNWKLGWVNTAWDAGKLWNDLQPRAVEIERLETELKKLKG